MFINTGKKNDIKDPKHQANSIMSCRGLSKEKP